MKEIEESCVKNIMDRRCFRIIESLLNSTDFFHDNICNKCILQNRCIGNRFLSPLKFRPQQESKLWERTL